MTAVFVVIAARAAGSVPSAGRALHLALLMLPIQFAIGAANDAADVDDDASAKPYKPIVRGTVNRGAASVVASILGAAGLAVAATFNPATFGLTAGGLGAGLAYDLGLRRTPLSWVPWWGGIALLPIAAYTAVGIFPPELFAVIPLALLVAVPLHCANGMPDIDVDRLAGRHSLPVVVGESGARKVILVGLTGAVIVAAGTDVVWGSRLRWAVVGVGALLLALVIVLAVRRPPRVFAPLAVAVAVFAVIWVAALPS